MRINPQRQFLSHKCLPAKEAPPHKECSVDVTSTDIGEYRLQAAQPIGRGSFSKVYLATSTITRERVAVKVVRQRDLREQLSKDLLRNEMTTIKEMRSPYVLCCLDIFITEAATYIVTEFCESDLAKLIQQRGCLDKSQARVLFCEMVKGFAHMRELGFIHRDLKPANVLLKSSTAKLADFGFAKQINRDGWVKERFNVGSPLYMSPEALSDNIYSEKSDIWSLGIVLYQMLTGKTPYRAQDERTLLHEMLTLDLSAVIRDNTPQQFHRLLEGCLCVDRHRRFGLGEVARALEIDVSDVDFTHSPILDEKQDYFRRIDKVLVNELNYVQFLRKLEGMLERRVDILSLKVRYVVAKNIRCRVNKLAKLQTKTNVYGMPRWQQFTRKATFSSYLTIVSRIQEMFLGNPQAPPVPAEKRFTSVLESKSEQNEKLILNYQFYLRQLLQRLHDELRESHFSSVKSDSLLMLTDFLVTAYQLNALHIQHYLDQASFADQSCLGIIVNGEPLVDDTVWQGLEKKFAALQLL